ncbi:MAG TPA: hypothetical protein VIR57_13765 [Chloroflexota bacterium]
MNSDSYVSTIRGVFAGSAMIEAIVIVGLAVLALVAVVLMAQQHREHGGADRRQSTICRPA